MMREIGAGQGEGKFCYAGCFFFKGQPHTSSRWKRRLTGQEAVGSSGPFKGTPDYGLPTLERVGEEGGDLHNPTKSRAAGQEAKPDQPASLLTLVTQIYFLVKN